MYPVINMEKTGLKLKIMIRRAGYDVKYIQQYLHLSCPQSIYRWFKGKTLPSVEHLCALSMLLGVHAEELLVFKNQSMISEVVQVTKDRRSKRMLAYYEYMCKVA